MTSLPFEHFFGAFKTLPSEFLSRLDRNFTQLFQEETPLAITVVSYTLKTDDKISSVRADATAGNVVVYLPATPTGNRRRTLTKTDAGANTVAFNGNGSLINGLSQKVLANQYDSVTVEPTGTGWIIVAIVP